MARRRSRPRGSSGPATAPTSSTPSPPPTRTRTSRGCGSAGWTSSPTASPPRSRPGAATSGSSPGSTTKLEKLTWRRFAAGLFQPLGLKIVDEKVYVLGRDGITRLDDLDGDGEADFYEAFNHDMAVTTGFHEFAFDLQTDPEGNFYFAKAGPVKSGGRGFDTIAANSGTVMKVYKDGKTLVNYATGFRAPNGIGVGPDGQVTSGDNEGTWMPKCRLNWVKPGGFFKEEAEGNCEA